MITLKAKDFSNRAELEFKIKSLVSDTPENKPDYEIKGTKAELARLFLSERTKVFGIKCVCTDFPTIIKTQDEIKKPFRGKNTKFSLK